MALFPVLALAGVLAVVLAGAAYVWGRSAGRTLGEAAGRAAGRDEERAKQDPSPPA